MERLAVLPLENLSSDISLDWMSRVAAKIVVEELAGSPSIHPVAVTARRDAVAFRATQLFQGYFTTAGERIELHAFLEDTGRRKITKTLRAEGPVTGGILPLAESLARQISGRLRPFGSENPEAIRAYADALASTDAASHNKALLRALAADPGFGQAHVALARLLLVRGDQEGVREAVENALATADRIDEISQAQLNLALVSLEEDPSLLASAMAKLALVMPADSDLAERTGRTILTTHRYSDAVDWFRKAAVADPSRPDLWNSLAYAQAYAGDLEGARASLARYEEAEPDNPNPLDSLGEVYFHHGRFAEAERFFLATHQKGPSFRGGVALMKAAKARLMTSEAAGAEQLFLQYVQLREQADDPLLDYLAARWRFWTGRRRQAMADLEELGRREGLRPEIASLAFAQLSIWALETGQALSARGYAGEAVDAAGPSATTAGAALCQFLTQPPVSAAEWEDRARRAFPHPSQAGLRKQALAYALLFSKQFPEAGAVLREMYEEAAPFTRGELRVLLAWTLIESGQFDEARALLSVHAVLQPGGESLLHGLVLPRAFYLRGVLAQQSGDEQAARDYYRLFLDCSGELPAMFGEEEKARQWLGSHLPDNVEAH